MMYEELFDLNEFEEISVEYFRKNSKGVTISADGAQVCISKYLMDELGWNSRTRLHFLGGKTSGRFALRPGYNEKHQIGILRVNIGKTGTAMISCKDLVTKILKMADGRRKFIGIVVDSGDGVNKILVCQPKED